MNVSIVIPVYNEAEHLGACLEAIALQTVQPLEVIVIDNNSTDSTVEVAGRYSFVRLISEKRQGVVHARNTGFNAAKGEIIGRIDADTLLPAGWVEQIQQIFTNQEIAAVSGAPDYYDFGLEKLANSIDWKLRGRLARQLGEENFLWGANMAVRRSAWHRVRASLCSARQLHEDLDLAIHLQEADLRVDYDATLLAGVSSRRVDTGFMNYIRYTLASPKTYATHGLKSQRHMYSVLAVCWLAYLPARLVYRAYDPQTKMFTLDQLFFGSTSRVDPTSNIA